MTSIGLNETAHGVEGNLQITSLLKRTSAGSITASATDATASTTGQAILYGLNSTLIAFFQLGSNGATGLCYATSTDLGQTWSVPAQISSKQNVAPAAVLNPQSGDVHLVYAIRGLPTADASHGIFYRVLAWNGSGWTVGGENTIIGGGVSGYGNVSLAVDGNGFLTCGFLRQLGSALTEYDLAISNGAWDLTSNTLSTGQLVAVTLNTNGRIWLSYLPEQSKWFAMTETGGTVRVYTSLSVLSSGAHSIAWTQQTTFFLSSTDQIDTAWNPSQGLAGQVGIVFANSTNVQFRTFDTTTNVLGAATTLNVATAKYPTITRQAQNWWLGWLELVSGNVYQVKVARSDALTTIYTLDIDPTAGDGWGWLRFPDDITSITTLVMLWSDTLDPESNGFNVYLGQVAVEVLKLVSTIATAIDAVIAGPTVSDTGTANDANLAAGVAKSVTDTGTGLDVIGLNPRSSDAGRIAETFAFGISEPAETGTATESYTITVQLAISEAGHGAETINVGVPIAVSDLSHITELLSRTFFDNEIGTIAETLGINVLVQDVVHGAESLLHGPVVQEHGTGTEQMGVGVGVNDTGSAVEMPGNGPLALDEVVASESLNAVNNGGGGPTGQQHYTILSVTGQHFNSFTGQPNGWKALSLVNDEFNTRLFVFEDVNSAYAGIAFATQPIGLTSYRKLLRSIDGGQTFNSVGPTQMAYIALAPDGSLWGVGNDGTSPAQPAPPPYGDSDGNGDFGWNITQRQLFHSTDKGASWGKVYDDQVYGSFGRYPSYTQVAVDTGGRVMAVGVARGAINGSEVQVLRKGSLNWETVQVPGSMMSARPVGTQILRVGYRVGESCFCAAGAGRFVFGGNFAQQLAVGPDRLWTSDDYGTTWDLRFSDDLLGSEDAPPVDITYRGGVLYAVRNDPLSERPNRHILTSKDNGTTWTLLNDPDTSGLFSAVAYDYKLHTLYVGTQNSNAPIWRMDAPDTGAWVNVLFNLDQVTSDFDPNTAYGGIGILSGIQLVFEIVVFDSGHGSDHAGQSYLLQDTATAVETLIVQHANRLTIRLFMHRGRVRLKLLGNQEPAVLINPGG